MSKTTTLIALLTLIVASFAAPVSAGMHGDDGKKAGHAAVTHAVEHYAAIADALAEDTVEGVPAHAKALQEMMPMCREMSAAMHGKMMKDEMKSGSKEEMKEHMESAEHGAMHENAEKAHQAISGALATLASADVELAAAREAFTTLSDHFVPMARMSYPDDAEKDYVVMHCPMAPGDGHWIQGTGDVHNPYHGSKMEKCGNKVAMLGQADEKPKGEKQSEGQSKGQSKGY